MCQFHLIDCALRRDDQEKSKEEEEAEREAAASAVSLFKVVGCATPI